MPEFPVEDLYDFMLDEMCDYRFERKEWYRKNTNIYDYFLKSEYKNYKSFAANEMYEAMKKEIKPDNNKNQNNLLEGQ